MTIYREVNLNSAFQALSDGTRRQIIEYLYSIPETSAGALVSLFSHSQPTISKHLSVLEKSGLISRRIQGREHIFSLNPNGLSCVETWVNRHQRIWDTSLDKLEGLLTPPSTDS